MIFTAVSFHFSTCWCGCYLGMSLRSCVLLHFHVTCIVFLLSDFDLSNPWFNVLSFCICVFVLILKFYCWYFILLWHNWFSWEIIVFFLERILFLLERINLSWFLFLIIDSSLTHHYSIIINTGTLSLGN